MPNYRSSEQNEILGTFLDMLKGPTGDGGAKRGRGDKVSWKIDAGHWSAAMRHIDRYSKDDETEDKDSGVHPLIHAAWRLLAVAWQDDEDWGRHPMNPDDEEKFRLAKELHDAIKARHPDDFHEVVL